MSNAIAESNCAVTAKASSFATERRPDFGGRLEAQYEVAERGKPVLNDEPVTVEEAIHAFINEKKGGKAAQNTWANHELTSGRLEDFRTAKTFIS